MVLRRQHHELDTVHGHHAVGVDDVPATSVLVHHRVAEICVVHLRFTVAVHENRAAEQARRVVEKCAV